MRHCSDLTNQEVLVERNGGMVWLKCKRTKAARETLNLRRAGYQPEPYYYPPEPRPPEPPCRGLKIEIDSRRQGWGLVALASLALFTKCL